MNREFDGRFGAARGARGKGFALLGVLFALSLAAPPPAAAQVWTPQAPGPNTLGQVENITDREVAGAVNSVASHPTDANVVYVGAVNGGIWRTTNATATNPHWEHQTDGQRSLSIGAIEFDPTDSTSRTLVAGVGRFSSKGRVGGERTGLLRTTDGGATWTVINGGNVISGLNISAVAPRGVTIVVAANTADNQINAGIWRSTNTGAGWTKISGGAGTGLPNGACADLAGDPSNPNRLYANAGRAGLFRSDNAGATWTKVSDAAMDALISGTTNLKISVGTSNNVYVAVAVAGQLAGVFRSGNSGGSWTAMALPGDLDGGAHPGGQADIHLSITADRNNAQIVYLGGDRQPQRMVNGQEVGGFPNTIGARDYSGRLFRGDASRPAASQWVHLTHSNALGPAGGGTASNSSPHADSRDMAIAANGTLIEADDGGVYRRTSPQTNGGDWFSMNGDLQATEFHAVAWDAASDIVIGGTQDTGTPEQRLSANVRWRSVSTGDGGVVAVDDTNTPGFSTRYSSFQFLLSFRRRVFNAANVLQSQVTPSMIVVGGGAAPIAQFYTPIRLNAVRPTRLIIGARNAVYESLDQGDTITEIGPGIRVNDFGPNIIAYGANGDAAALYVGSADRVFTRVGAGATSLTRSTAYNGGEVVAVAMNPNDARVAFVAARAGRVFMTNNAGGQWNEITGNLAALAPGALRSAVFSTTTTAGAVMVAADRGVFQAAGPGFNNWSRLGTGLPNAPVADLEYDATDRLLVAGTLGRGAWTLRFQPPPPPGPEATSQNVTPAAAEETTSDGNNSLPPSTSQPPAENQQPGNTTQPGNTQPQGNQNVFQLRSGIVVDPNRGEIYFMSPSRGVDAVNISNGQRVWHSDAGSKPLAVVGPQLLTQAEEPTAANDLQIVVMDSASGARRVTGTVDLPPGVIPLVRETPMGRFIATAQPAGAEAVVAWRFAGQAVRGVPPDTEATLPGAVGPVGPAAAGETIRNGASRMNLSTGATSSVTLPPNITFSEPGAATLPPEERVPGVPETQFLSSDGRHILVSERVGDDRELNKYRLTVYERETKTRVGAFRSHVAFVPFFVRGTTAVFRTERYARKSGDDMVTEPLKVRGLDLTTGNEVWSWEVRDPSYEGPFPP